MCGLDVGVQDSASLLDEIKNMQNTYVKKAKQRVQSVSATARICLLLGVCLPPPVALTRAVLLVAQSSGRGAGNLAEIAEDKGALDELKEKRAVATQKSEEKVAIAVQTYELIDNHIRRLDADIKMFGSKLKISGEFDDGTAQKRGRSEGQGGQAKKARKVSVHRCGACAGCTRADGWQSQDTQRGRGAAAAGATAVEAAAAATGTAVSAADRTCKCDFACRLTGRVVSVAVHGGIGGAGCGPERADVLFLQSSVVR